MKVKISDTESYWVVWNYPKKEVVFNEGDPDERIERHPNGESFCFIYDDSVEGEPKLVCSGVAFCGVKDRFSRKFGREISFERALAKLFRPDENKALVFRKVFRNRNKNEVYEQ